MQTRTHNAVFFLTSGFDLLELSAALSVFTRVGQAWNWRAFRIQLAGEEPKPLQSNSQIEVGPVTRLPEVTMADALIILGSHQRRGASSPSTHAALRALAANARALLFVSNGLTTAAALGLLRGRRVACERELLPEIAALDASIVRSTLPVETDGSIVTAATPDAVAEASLRIVSLLFGPKLAQKTASELGLPEPIVVGGLSELDLPGLAR